MELVCIDKQTFEELRVRFCEFEDRVTGLCRPVEDLGLKNWLDNQEVCTINPPFAWTSSAYLGRVIFSSSG